MQNGIRFVHAADFVDHFNILKREIRDEDAAFGQNFYEAFLLQSAERIPDGGAADMKILLQELFIEHGAGGIVTGENAAANLIIGEDFQRLFFGHRKTSFEQYF